MHKVGSKMRYWVLGNAKIGSKVGFCGSLKKTTVLILMMLYSMYNKRRGADGLCLDFPTRDLRLGFSFEFLLAESISLPLSLIFNNM